MVDKKYTHFAIRKSDNKIVDGWDYKGIEPDEIKYYTKIDLKNNFPDEKLSNFSIASGKNLINKGINPFDWANWGNSENKNINENINYKGTNYSNEIIKEMRDWLSDLTFSDEVDFNELEDTEILSAINRYYEGGLSAFVNSVN